MLCWNFTAVLPRGFPEALLPLEAWRLFEQTRITWRVLFSIHWQYSHNNMTYSSGFVFLVFEHQLLTRTHRSVEFLAIHPFVINFVLVLQKITVPETRGNDEEFNCMTWEKHHVRELSNKIWLVGGWHACRLRYIFNRDVLLQCAIDHNLLGGPSHSQNMLRARVTHPKHSGERKGRA